MNERAARGNSKIVLIAAIVHDIYRQYLVPCFQKPRDYYLPIERKNLVVDKWSTYLIIFYLKYSTLSRI